MDITYLFPNSCMNSDQKTLSYKDAVLCYTIYGNGPKKVIAFHGFGQDSSVFKAYAQMLGNDYSLYSFDLFFHGNSVWPHGEAPLQKEAWKNIFQAFKAQEQIERFALIGFSIGAKVLLTTLAYFADTVTDITLVAPDGIKTNFWYKLATSSSFFRKCFRHLIAKPGLFFNSLELLGKFNLLDKNLIRFIKSQMKTTSLRQKVYNTWMVYRKLSFKKASIATIINAHTIPTTVFLGASDKVIRKKQLNNFLSQLKHYDLKIIPGNHVHVLQNFIDQQKPGQL